MSFAIDVNLLLYASDAGSPKHAKAREFIETSARGPEVFCFAWATLLGYLRMATHPSIFTRPLAHDEAAGNVAALLRQHGVKVLYTHDRDFRKFSFLEVRDPLA